MIIGYHVDNYYDVLFVVVDDDYDDVLWLYES
jgi:hypothetical protein